MPMQRDKEMPQVKPVMRCCVDIDSADPTSMLQQHVHEPRLLPVLVAEYDIQELPRNVEPVVIPATQATFLDDSITEEQAENNAVDDRGEISLTRTKGHRRRRAGPLLPQGCWTSKMQGDNAPRVDADWKVDPDQSWGIPATVEAVDDSAVPDEAADGSGGDAAAEVSENSAAPDSTAVIAIAVAGDDGLHNCKSL